MTTTVTLSDGDSWDVYVEPDGSGATCVFDGALGWHNIYRVVDLAVSHGMVLSAEDGTIMGSYAAQRETTDVPFNVAELASEICDEAETFLTSLCPDGWSFGWHDGDFFLANAAWWEAV